MGPESKYSINLNFQCGDGPYIYNTRCRLSVKALTYLIDSSSRERASFVSLMIDTGEDEDIEQQQEDPDGYGYRQGSRVALVVTGG